jgi:hypothetical protein
LHFRGAGLVAFQGYAGIDRPAVQMFEFIEPVEHVVFNRLGESHIVRGENQFHKKKMQLLRGEIQFLLRQKLQSGFRAKSACCSARLVYAPT